MDDGTCAEFRRPCRVALLIMMDFFVAFTGGFRSPSLTPPPATRRDASGTQQLSWNAPLDAFAPSRGVVV